MERHPAIASVKEVAGVLCLLALCRLFPSPAYAQLQAYLREAPDGPAAESVKKMVKRLESTSRADPSADGSIDLLDSTR